MYRHLAQNKHLLEIAGARFTSLTLGIDHVRVDTARERLSAAGAALTGAAGGISVWTRTWLGMGALGVAAWAVAAFAGQLIGLSTGWTITVTVAVALVLLWPFAVLNDALADRVNRRRTTWRASPLEIVVPDDLDAADEVILILWGVRDGLAIVMKRWSTEHRFGYVARNAAGFDWLRRHDRHLFDLSVADRCVCQAIESIEVWLDARGRTR